MGVLHVAQSGPSGPGYLAVARVEMGLGRRFGATVAHPLKRRTGAHHVGPQFQLPSSDQPRPESGSAVLRPFCSDDLPVVEDGATDRYVRLITGLEAHDRSGARAYLERQSWRQERGLGFSFAIADATTCEAVGQIGLWLRAQAPDGATGYREEAHGRAAIGYWVAPSRRRRGYATDALRAISDWALGLPEVYRLELFIEPWNEGSWRAAEAAAFEREGLLRSWQAIGGERRDMFAYSRLRLAR